MRVGAGRPGWHKKAESARHIDIRRWQRDGIIEAGYVGRWNWYDPDTFQVNAWIDVAITALAARLRFIADGQRFDQTVAFARSGCHFGGKRPWFKCPTCSRRTALLYVDQRGFACRVCQSLAYASQSEDAIDRSWRKQGKLEATIGQRRARPKGMHNSTYMDRLARIHDCEQDRRVEVLRRIQKLL